MMMMMMCPPKLHCTVRSLDFYLRTGKMNTLGALALTHSLIQLFNPS
jgi:hypothetical protein